MAAAAVLPPPSAVYTDERGVPRAAVGLPLGGSGPAGGRERLQGVGPDVNVQIPSDSRQRVVIDAVAFYVMRDGCEFEQVQCQGEGNLEPCGARPTMAQLVAAHTLRGLAPLPCRL